MIVLQCQMCLKTFKSYLSENRKYCSRKCFSKIAIKNLGNRFTGMKHKPESIEKIRLANIEVKKKYWKGSKCSYQTLHQWIRRYRGIPKICEHCHTKTAKRYEWANVSGEYRRDLNDYIRLCYRCHRHFDGFKGY